MPYDENSFLQGIAVGRSMKGVTVVNQRGGERVQVLSGVLDAIIPFYSPILALPGGAAGTVAVSNAFIRLDGETIAAAATPPSSLSMAGITAAGTFAPNPVTPLPQTATPGTLGGTVGASAVITTDE